MFLVIRRRTSSRAWCQKCGANVDMVGLGEVKTLPGMSLQHHAEIHGWHLLESQEGTTLICLSSLLNSK